MDEKRLERLDQEIMSIRAYIAQELIKGAEMDEEDQHLEILIDIGFMATRLRNLKKIQAKY